MKAYITKYALTQGILEKEVRAVESCPTMVVVENSRFQEAFHKPFWHTTREEAVAQAEKMRIAKIKSVEKQLKKLQNMQF